MSSVISKIKNGKSDEKEYYMPEAVYSDLSDYRYTRTWTQGLKVNVYGYEVNIPDMPPQEDIVNFGRPISEQIFRKTAVPEGLEFMDEDDKEAFIEREHHRRIEGMWFYIKGEPIYITGTFYYFLNYWVPQTGDKVFFRMGDWKFFIIWLHVVLTPWIHGLVDFKCRRIGDTEKALCILYEYASRVKNTLNQLFDCRTEPDIVETFQRLKFAHKNMTWFMRPVAKKDDAAKELDFSFPQLKTEKGESYIDENGRLQNFKYEFPEIGSKIGYFTNAGAPDGKRLGRLYVDEFGKKKTISPKKLWKVGKKALEDPAHGSIIGKGLFTSTIEDLQGGESLEEAKYFWEKSDPANVNHKGQTTTGLIRIIRSVLDREKMDRWGFHDEKAILEDIKKERDHLIKNKEWAELIVHKRQNCLTIEDIFSNISEGSPFDLEKVNSRHNEITISDSQIYVRGNLDWVDGKRPIPGDPEKNNKDRKAFFTPVENGRWCFAYFPKDFKLKENAQKPMAKVPVPGNTKYFACGIDPVSYKDNIESSNRSLAGVSVKRVLDYRIDTKNNSDLWDDNGQPVDGGRFFKTNRYCCTYLYRHNNPSDNYNDWLLTIVFFGTDFLIEKNHGGGFENYLTERGYLEYYMDKSGLKNYKGKEESFGLTASEKAVQTYVSAMGELVSNWWNTIDIPDITGQYQTFEYETRGKHDLGVSTGFCEVAASQKLVENEKYFNHEKEEEEGVYMGEVNYQFE